MEEKTYRGEIISILVKLSEALINSATLILFLRILYEKKLVEELATIKTFGENDKDNWNLLIKFMEQLKKKDHWNKSWYSKEHFDNTVLSRNLSKRNWEDQNELISIENDCRSLALIVRLCADEISKQNPIPIDLIDIHNKGLQLYYVASCAIGYWLPNLHLLLQKTQGYLQPVFKKNKHILGIALLLDLHGGKVTASLLKEAKILTGKSDSRIREYIQEAKRVRKLYKSRVEELLAVLKTTKP